MSIKLTPNRPLAFISRGIAKCPECGGRIAVEAREFSFDRPLKESLHLDCEFELLRLHEWKHADWQPVLDTIAAHLDAEEAIPYAQVMDELEDVDRPQSMY